MTVIARFEVIPVRDGSMSTAIASALRALDRHPVSYETTATDTIIEAESAEQVFAAVQAAHQAIPEDRVITSVEIDEDRRRPQNMNERVASVERELGHPPQRRQQPQMQGGPGQSQQPGMGQSPQLRSTGQSMGGQPAGQPSQRQPTGPSMEGHSAGQTMGSRPAGQSMGSQPAGQSSGSGPTGQPMGPQTSGQSMQSRPSERSMQPQSPEQPPGPTR